MALHRYVCEECGLEETLQFIGPAPERRNCIGCGEDYGMVKRPPRVKNHFHPSKKKLAGGLDGAGD